MLKFFYAKIKVQNKFIKDYVKLHLLSLINAYNKENIQGNLFFLNKKINKDNSFIGLLVIDCAAHNSVFTDEFGE